MSGRSPQSPSNGPVSGGESEEACRVLELLKSLGALPDEQDLLDMDERPSTRMIYTNGVTLWLLILQRLHGGKTLNETVSHLVQHQLALLPNNKRVREGRVSENSGAYSQARKRLPLEFVHSISEALCQSLIEMSPGVVDGRRVFILDGTTFTLPPTKELREAFPPAPNQHGGSVWPVAMLMVANEMQSGCTLLPQIDPMYGENNSSEAVQAARIVRQLPPNSIILADAGFGIYSVAHHTLAAGHAILLRLTRTRYKSMRRRAELIDEGPTHKSYRLTWKPSYKDRSSTPELPPEAALEVVLHEVQISSDQALFLVSTLEIDALCCAEIYNRRYDVEFDIRDLKVTMDAENIRAKKVDMVMKELYTSIVAYNLVAQFRRQAATQGGVKPRTLRFKDVWTTFKDRLLFAPPCSFEQWQQRFEKALIAASKKKHPNRPKPRSYPRQAYPRRTKSTKFEKAMGRRKPDKPAAKPVK